MLRVAARDLTGLDTGTDGDTDTKQRDGRPAAAGAAV
jgi:hypothetical protein